MSDAKSPRQPYSKLVVVRSQRADGREGAFEQLLEETGLRDTPGAVAGQVFGLVDVQGRAAPGYEWLTLIECDRPPAIDIADWVTAVFALGRPGRSVSIFVPISTRVATGDDDPLGPRPDARNIHFVETNAIGGREDEFNDWYTAVHVDDVLRVPGFVAGQRFERKVPFGTSPARHGYLAVYEVAGDPVAANELLRVAVKSMVISPAMRQGDSQSNFFAPRTRRMLA